MNLKQELINSLKIVGKTINDIKWVGTIEGRIPIDHFLKLADIEYDSGFGAPEVATDLVIVGDDWWLERENYDGSKYFVYKHQPKMPKFEYPTNEITALTVNQYNKQHPNCKRVGWQSLHNLNYKTR